MRIMRPWPEKASCPVFTKISVFIRINTSITLHDLSKSSASMYADSWYHSPNHASSIPSPEHYFLSRMPPLLPQRYCSGHHTQKSHPGITHHALLNTPVHRQWCICHIRHRIAPPYPVLFPPLLPAQLLFLLPIPNTPPILLPPPIIPQRAEPHALKPHMRRPKPTTPHPPPSLPLRAHLTAPPRRIQHALRREIGPVLQHLVRRARRHLAPRHGAQQLLFPSRAGR